MITGVYAKENFEIAISKHFKVIHYLIVSSLFKMQSESYKD